MNFKPSCCLSDFLSKTMSTMPLKNEKKHIITLVNRGYDNSSVKSYIIGETKELSADANSGIVIITPIAYFLNKISLQMKDLFP